MKGGPVPKEASPPKIVLPSPQGKGRSEFMGSSSSGMGLPEPLEEMSAQEQMYSLEARLGWERWGK